MNARQFGPELTKDGTRFRLWAPAAKRVDLLLQQSHAMIRGDDGWFSIDLPDAKAGTRYKFRIDDEIDVHVRVSRIGMTSVTFEFAAYRARDDVLMVTAHQTLVYVDLARREKCPVPDDFRVAIREREGEDLER